MGFFYLLLALLLLLLLSGLLSLWRWWRRHTLMPYRLAERPFAPHEVRLLAALDAALGPGYRVFAKVLAEDVIAIAPRIRGELRERALARLADPRFDFLICDAVDLRVLGAIELTDERPGPLRRRRATSLAPICRAAGLPLVRLAIADQYDPADLAKSLSSALSRSQTSDHPSQSVKMPSLGKGRRTEETIAPQDEARLLSELAMAIRDDEPSISRTPQIVSRD